MKSVSAYFFISCLSMMLSMQAEARVIKEGAVSFDVSGFNESRRYDDATNSDEYRIDVFGGYFFADNFEVGTGMSYDHYSIASQTNTAWTLSPVIRYHVPVSEDSSVYLGAGVFITNKETTSNANSTASEDSVGYTAEVGWEYFFNPKVALTITASYSRVSWDLDGYSVPSDNEDRFYWPRIGIKTFF